MDRPTIKEVLYELPSSITRSTFKHACIEDDLVVTDLDGEPESEVTPKRSINEYVHINTQNASLDLPPMITYAFGDVKDPNHVVIQLELYQCQKKDIVQQRMRRELKEGTYG